LLADAWGDVEDPNQWPIEIRQKYPLSGKRPPTILEAVRQIKGPDLSWNPITWVNTESLNTLAFLVVGTPRLPGCYQPMNEKKDKEGMPIPEKTYPNSKGIVRALFDDEVRARLYNIFQVIDVMEENSPGGEIIPSYQTGLEFFRNLFFELTYSTRDENRGYGDDVNQSLDGHHLTIVSYSNKFGGLRQIGRLIQNVKKDDPALRDLFNTLIHASKSPVVRQLMVYLHSTREGRNLLWSLMRELFSQVNQGSDADTQRLKNLGYYLMAAMNQLEPWTPPAGPPGREDFRNMSPEDFLKQDLVPNDLLEHMVKGAFEISKNPVFREFLTRDKDGLLKDLMTSQRLTSFLENSYLKSNPKRAARVNRLLTDFVSSVGPGGVSRIQSGMEVLKAIYEDPKTKEDWNRAFSRWEALRKSDSYQNLSFYDAVTPMLRFFEEVDSQVPGKSRTPEEIELARKLRANLSRMLESGEIHELLEFAKTHPDSFDQIMKTLSQYIGEGDQGELKDFFKVVHGRLSAPKY
jgi:hypothetical protein